MLSKTASSAIFWVFGMTRLDIDPRSPGPLVNTLLIIFYNTKSIIEWRHRLLWNCSRCVARRYISPVPFYHMLRMSIDLMKENGFTLAKESSRRYPRQTIPDADYTDDIALLINTAAHTESPLHSLEQVVSGIGVTVNAEKTEHMCFNQRGAISILNSGPLKLVDKFTYLGNRVSCTENDINTWLAWTAIDRWPVIWRSKLSDKIKRSFFKSCCFINTAIWMPNVDAD